MHNKQVIIIAAMCSRPYVAAANAAGFAVIALDAFADADTTSMASEVYQIDCVDAQFDAVQLLQTLDSLDLSEVIGLCYGAGFEAQPELLDAISLRLPVLGNSANTVKNCKHPQTLFALCDALNMAYPPTRMEVPADTIGWLSKQIGGSGGSHILPALANANTAHTPSIYYQQVQAGKPVSCLFLASNAGVQIIGFNLQWHSATAQQPYRYGGAASHYALSPQLQQQLKQFIQQASTAFGLVGLNSCDAIVHNDTLYMLEINPRLSASIDLYTLMEGHLLAVHIAACLQQPVQPLNVSPTAKAHQVVYATHHQSIAEQFVWPEWVSDIPHSAQTMATGMPICTATAQADTYLAAQQLVAQRAHSIHLSIHTR